MLAPPGWRLLDLSAQDLLTPVRRLVEGRFRGRDDLTLLRHALVDELVLQAETARSCGGLQLWLSVEEVAGVSLPASLLVSSIPVGDAVLPSLEVARQVLEERRAQAQDEGVPATLEDLGLGPALRTVRTQDERTVVEYVVPVPGGSGWLLLTYSTPLEDTGLVAAVVELFDSMAGATTWR